MKQHTADEAPNPQINNMHNADIQIKALSEFIGRNMLANQVLENNDTISLEGTGLEESSLPLYNVDTKQPLSIQEVADNRDELIGQKKVEPMTGAFRREELYLQYPNGFSTDETVLAVDVAGLKLLNDFYGGHKTGDIALMSAIASILKIFSDSRVFRTGGDEFVVVTKNEVSEDSWNTINEEYLTNVNSATGQNITENESLLRAGIGKIEQNEDDSFSPKLSTDEVVGSADEAEVKISALLKILGNSGAPRIASLDEIDIWMKDNNIELVDKGDKIVAYQTWKAGGRKLLPKYLRKRGSTRVRGR